jgi:hypothetical protein
MQDAQLADIDHRGGYQVVADAQAPSELANVEKRQHLWVCRSNLTYKSSKQDVREKLNNQFAHP